MFFRKRRCLESTWVSRHYSYIVIIFGYRRWKSKELKTIYVSRVNRYNITRFYGPKIIVLILNFIFICALSIFDILYIVYML